MKKIIFLVLFFVIPSLFFAEKISFHADKMRGSTKKDTDSTILTGNALIVTDNMELKADQIEISGKNFRYIKANGNVVGKIKDSQMDFTCSEMTYDREKKIAVLQNSVHLVDTKNNVVADAEIIDYNQSTDIAVLQINVNMVQGKNTCTAAHAIYKKNEQMLIMSGNPSVQQGNDRFRAQEIVLNLKTEEISLDGRVRGSVTADDTKTKTPEPSKVDKTDLSPGNSQSDDEKNLTTEQKSEENQ